MLEDSRVSQVLSVPQSCVVPTPEELAFAMVQVLGNEQSDIWLEPCIGEGALLRAMAMHGVQSHQILGIDIDRRPQPSDALAQVLRGTEFLQWSLTAEKRFSKIIANPPYIAIERLHPRIKRAVQDVADHCRTPIKISGNAWYAFLCVAINLLRRGGSLCFLLPAAWDFANYARPLRLTIGRRFESVKIFRSKLPLFGAEGIQEGAVVLVAKNYHGDVLGMEASFDDVLRYEVPCISALINELSASTTNGHQIVRKLRRGKVAPGAIAQTRHLSELISLRLGAVTGDSQYFVLNEEQRKERRLPLRAVKPVVSKARHLTTAITSRSDWAKLRDCGERVWLFNPSPSIMKHSAVRAYLRHGQNGGCNLGAHKIANRRSWCRTPMPEAAHGFISGMSAKGPWISLCEMSNLSATNTLYVVRFNNHLISLTERCSIALLLLTSSVQRQFKALGRNYAAGLVKFEPSDLLNVRVPSISSGKGAIKTYRNAVKLLAQNQHKKAKRLADSWLKDAQTKKPKPTSRLN